MEKKKFIRIDGWKYTNPEDEKIQYDGKLIYIAFDKIFNRPNNNTNINTFIIKKDSYVKQLDKITQYLNYFIKYYDDDNELLMSYLKLKYVINNKSKKLNIGSFIKLVYGVLFTKSIKEKICKLVDDNYYIDVNMKKKKYPEPLEFNNEHAIILMKISISIKMIIPVMMHYINTYGLNKQKNLIFCFYEKLFTMYSNEIDMYNKLWIYVNARVNENFSHNKPIWEQREIHGKNPLILADSLLKDKIISESIFKYRFNDSVVSFNTVITNFQLKFFIREKYKHTPFELTDTKDGAEGLSMVDKLEMNSSKVDESHAILSDKNIKRTIKKIENIMSIKVTKKEIKYYLENHNKSRFHVEMINYFYARYFNGYRDLRLIGKKKYMKLVILLKRRLQIQGNKYLPQILTGNIENKLNTRTIQNSKFLNKIENSAIYQSMMENKFSTLKEIGKENLPINLLSTILNSQFTYVDYDFPDKMGEKIEVNGDAISDEFLNYLNQL